MNGEKFTLPPCPATELIVGEREKKPLWNMTKHSVLFFLTRFFLNEKLVNLNLTYWGIIEPVWPGEGKYSTPAHSSNHETAYEILWLVIVETDVDLLHLHWWKKSRCTSRYFSSWGRGIVNRCWKKLQGYWLIRGVDHRRKYYFPIKDFVVLHGI